MSGLRCMELILLTVISVACGTGQNINQVFLSQEEKEVVESLQQRAQKAFDQGKLVQAQRLAEKAYTVNPSSEATSMLLAYIHLSQAGIDPLQLARNMIQINSKSSATDAEAEEDRCKSSSSSDATAFLATLSCVMGMSEEELAFLVMDGNKVTVSGKEISGLSANSLFKDYPMKLPKSATAAREVESELMQNIGLAIEYVCPFVSDSVKSAVDGRHKSAKCEETKGTVEFPSKAHFIFAMAHLTEAIAFNSIVLYTALDQTTPSLIARAKAMSGANFSNPSDFVSSLSELNDVLGIVMPTANADDGMLNMIFTDLDTAVKAFAAIAGLPDSIIKKLESSLNNLKSATSKIGSTSSESEKNASAMRTQLVSKISGKLESKLSSEISKMDAAKQKEACESYKSIAGTSAKVCS